MQRYDDSANRQNIRDTFFGKPSISHPYTLFIIRARREKAIKGILLTLLIYTLNNKCFKPHIKTHYSSLQGNIYACFSKIRVKNHGKYLFSAKKEERKNNQNKAFLYENWLFFTPKWVCITKMNCNNCNTATKHKMMCRRPPKNMLYNI